MKLTYEQKLEICRLKEEGLSYRYIAKLFNLNKRKIEYIWHLYENHGEDKLKHKFNKWTKTQKELAIKRVINGESINRVALDIGLTSNSLLSSWIKRYKENGYTIVERKRGRPPMNKSSTNKKDNLTPKQREIKDLEKRIKELEIENEYLKKLDALVQKRKAQQLKKKSQ